MQTGKITTFKTVNAAQLFDLNGVEVVGVLESIETIGSGGTLKTIVWNGVTPGLYDLNLLQDEDEVHFGIPVRFTTDSWAVVDTASEILAKLSGGSVTWNSPVTATGKLNGPIVKGDDYLASSSRAFDWFFEPGSFSVGQATCWFGGARQADPQTSSWKVQGVVSPVTISGQPRWRLRFELTTAVTGLLVCDLHEWSVELRGPSDENITKLFGQVRVVDSYTR
jgi:hypothetical protein